MSNKRYYQDPRTGNVMPEWQIKRYDRFLPNGVSLNDLIVLTEEEAEKIKSEKQKSQTKEAKNAVAKK